MKISIIKSIVLFVLLFTSTEVYTQKTLYTNGYTTSGSNAYQTINTNLFLTPAASTDPNPIKHFFTLLKRSYKLRNMFTGSITPTGSPILDAGLKMWKVKYTKDITANVVIIRPDDTLTRPCILLAAGAGADYSKVSNSLYIGAVDYAMRGFVVAFYEHAVSATFISNNALAIFLSKLQMDSYISSNPQFAGQNNYFYNAIWPSYIGWQLSLSLEQTLKLNASNFGINSNWLFAAGHSAGAGFSLQLGYAQTDSNFLHSFYSTYKPDNRYCLNQSIPITRNIKAVAAIDGALREDDSILPGFYGKMISYNDSLVPTLFLHGKNDNSVNINKTTIISPFWTSANGPFVLSTEIKNKTSGKSQTIVNCESGHLFATLFDVSSFSGSGSTATPNYSITLDQDNAGAMGSAIEALPVPDTIDLVSTSTYVQTNRSNIYSIIPYMTQLQDECYYISKFFNDRMDNFSTMTSYIKYTHSVSSYTNQLSTKFLSEISNIVCSDLTPPSLRLKNTTVHSLKLDSTFVIKEKEILIYPNPSSTEFTIEINGFKNSFNVQIFSIIGESVYS